MSGLLRHTHRGAQLFLLRGQRGDRRVVAPLAREQRLEMALDFVGDALAPLHGRVNPLSRGVMRLGGRDVAVDMIDDGCVELLLPGQDAAEQAAGARREA